ncbi:type II toxin-antitoxin system VapC family toxin, partial [bacterium]|nr:type II toxin-antitoxin system VapC family toxin [bacterium]MBU1917835.1 type II toxin-antitoxin system VapC family toxin [bacterium]
MIAKSISNKSNQFFLDSSFVIALMDAADVFHKKAQKINETILLDNQIFISDVVINEVLSVFAKRCESKKKKSHFAKLTETFQKALETIPILCLYELLPTQYNKIISLMVKTQGTLNFHDALIVLFLKEIPDVTLVSFDKDFQTI